MTVITVLFGAHSMDAQTGLCSCTSSSVQTYLQGHGMHGHGETVHIPFPFDEEDLKAGESF